MKYIFRGLGGADIWRHGEYKNEIEYMGKKGPAIYVPKKGVYFIDNTKTVSMWSGKRDKKGKPIYPGDVLRNDKGQLFEVRFGEFTMYCPVDNMMMENVGFYVVSEGYYEDMPLGPTEDYATIVGNIFNNPELKVDLRYRSLAETERECR